MAAPKSTDVIPLSSPNESIRQLMWGSWRALEGTRGRFFLFVFLFVCAYSIDLLSPWAIGYTLGVFVERGFGDEALGSALLGVGAYVGIRLVHTVLHHFGRYVQLTVSFSARMKTLEQVFSKLLAFPLRWHVEHHSGENLSRLHRIAGAIDQTIGTFVWQIVEGLTKIVFASVALFALDTWVAVNVAAMGFCTLLIMVLFNQRLITAIRANNAFSDRLNQTFVDYLFHVVTIKSLSLERPAVEYMRNCRAGGYGLNRRIVRYSELKWGSVGLGYTLVIGSSLVIYFLGHRGTGTPIAVAEVYVLINYLDRIFQAIGSFTGYYSGILEAATAYEAAVNIDRDARAFQSGPRAPAMPNEWKTLTIKDLDFAYTLDRSGGLSTKELTIQRGEKIALVGPSGAGKSTLLKIVGGLLVPEKCEILLDSSKVVALDSVTQSSLILPQEPEIFSETAAYNLAMGEEFSERELRFFVTLCKLDEVLEKLPKGWESSLAESGMNISVGEKQRLALARGLLRARRRAILLLDEPTSSLDPATEKQIFQSMLHHFADRTVLTACHRLALVPLFDRVIFVRRGIIEESGSFQELLDKKGLFYQVWLDYETTQRTGVGG